MSVVITHPEFGIYLGNCSGMGFWSKLDPVGQPAAITFPSKEVAQSHAAEWDEQIGGLEFRNVEPDCFQYATVEACVAAGLEAWDPSRADDSAPRLT